MKPKSADIGDLAIQHDGGLSKPEPARFVKKLKDHTIPMSKKLTLECAFTGSPKMFVTWYKNGKQLYASYRYNTKVKNNKCILECLHPCNQETSAIYSCEVSNPYGIDICHAQIVAVPEPPQFVTKLKDMSVSTAKKLRLECTFTGAQKMFVTWYKDGKQVYASYRHNTKLTKKSCILECLHESNAETTGRYSCEISNKYGTDVCYAQITAVADPAHFVKKLKDVSIPMSQKLRLECTFAGAPKMFVTWYKNDKQLYASYRYNTKVIGNTCILECLHECNKDTTAKYSCEVSNKFGSDRCHAEVNTVTDSPRFVKKLSNMQVYIGKKMTLECTFTGAPKIFVTWYKNGKQLYASYRHNTKLIGNKCIVECLHGSSRDTAGRYSCEISNSHGSTICHADITVGTDTPHFMKKLVDKTLPLNKMLKLECTFTAAQKVSVTWYKNGKQLSDGYNTKVSNNYCMLEGLHKPSKETTGKYSCEISNGYGTAICHAQITADPESARFVKKLQNLLIPMSQKLKLECTFSGAPDMSATWYKDGEELKTSDKYKTKISDNSCILESLHECKKEMAGRYSCKISNQYGTALCHAQVSPIAEPARFVKRLEDVSFPLSKKLRLECTFKEAPKMFVTWYKDGKQLYASYRYNTKVIGNSCILECLHECNKDTPGRYSCEVSNLHGADICHAQVTTVTEPPKFVKKLKDHTVPMTKKLRLECTFTGAPKMFVTWYKEGKQVYASYRYNTKVIGNTCILECLHEANKDTSGKYSCEVNNAYGSVICHAQVTAVTEPAQFVMKLQNLTIPMAQKLRLVCTFTGAPKLFVTWYKNGKQLYASYRYNTKVTKNSCILECLHECNKDTSGTYSCEVSNSYGTDICHAQITAVTEPARIVKKLKDVTVPMSQCLKLECTFTGAPKMFVTWYKDGKQLYASYRYNTKLVGNKCIMEALHPCNSDTPGTYSCEVSNSYGTDICHAEVSTSPDSPKFVKKLSDRILKVGDKLYLECTFTGAEKMFVTWYKDGKQVYGSYRHNTKLTGSACILEGLHESTRRTTGRYSCEISNSHGSDFCHAQINVGPEPPLFVTPLEDLTIPLSEKLRLECTFTGAPQMFVTWYKNDKQLYASYRHNTKVIGNKCIVEALHPCNRETSGKYSCEISNSYGTVVCHAHVKTSGVCPDDTSSVAKAPAATDVKKAPETTDVKKAPETTDVKKAPETTDVKKVSGSGEPARFVKKLKDVHVTIGQKLKLECEFKGTPKMFVTWYKNGKQLYASYRHNTKVAGTRCVLECLHDTKKDTAGRYSCEVSNSCGTDICHAEVAVATEPARFVTQLKDQFIPMSKRLILECKFTGSPKMFVTWYKNGKQLYASYRYNTKVTKNSCILECLHPCNEGTTADYSCEVSNACGTDVCHAQVVAVPEPTEFVSKGRYSDQVTAVPEPPRFVKNLKDVSIPMSQKLRLECTFAGAPKMFVTWYRNDKQLYASYRYNTKVIGNTCILECLHECNQDTNGRYSCEVSNKFGSDICHADVTTVKDVPRFVKKLPNIQVYYGEKMTLECTFTGAPKMFVTWYKDGKQLYASYRHNTKLIGNKCIVECLHGSTNETAGIYSCEISNSHGSAVCHAEVKVGKDAPHFVKKLTDITIPTSEKLRLECTFTGAQKIFVTWYKDGKQVYASYRYNTIVNNNSCVLECLHKSKKETTGKYSCEISNSFGKAVCHAQITAGPGFAYFERKLENLLIPMSQKLKLECAFTGTPKIFVTWYKDGKQLYASYRHNTKQTENSCAVECLQKCKKETAGRYSCEITNKHGSTMCHAYVFPVPEPARFVKRLENVTFPLSKKLRLECTFKGAPKMFVTWYKDGKQLYASYRYNTKVIGNSCILECLHECNSNTPGKYSCEVSNSYGTDICHAQVTAVTDSGIFVWPAGKSHHQ
ncbi:titin-like isoform X2 [Sardina pilchardus]|uniref:titin-like isoform X2 n=1 Tax=Sardina pilchardus TaxID=27697 RepID=UPI002E1121AF